MGLHGAPQSLGWEGHCRVEGRQYRSMIRERRVNMTVTEVLCSRGVSEAMKEQSKEERITWGSTNFLWSCEVKTL